MSPCTGMISLQIPYPRLEIGDMIPPELYEVVAEILVFVDAMDKIKAKMDAHKK